MIDTVKVYCYVLDNIKKIIDTKGCLRGCYNLLTGEIQYEIVTNSIERSYSSKISIKCNTYNDKGWILSIEGSLHKVFHGQNAFNGFYDLKQIVYYLKSIVEKEYDINLPNVDDFYIFRVDIARVFDLETQKNVNDYLYRLSFLNYPRRKVLYYENESLYIPGNSTTLKIYNKLEEFKVHDLKKKHNFDFNTVSFQDKIKGYLRYECEIRKRFLTRFCENKHHKSYKEININDINYKDLEEIWRDEFMKLYSFYEENVISDKLKIKERLSNIYGQSKGNRLYSFYLSLVADGERQILKNFTKEKDGKNIVMSTYYRNKRDLKKVGIDYSQRYEFQKISENGIVDFNPFMSTLKEVV